MGERFGKRQVTIKLTEKMLGTVPVAACGEALCWQG